MFPRVSSDTLLLYGRTSGIQSVKTMNVSQLSTQSSSESSSSTSSASARQSVIVGNLSLSSPENKSVAHSILEKIGPLVISMQEVIEESFRRMMTCVDVELRCSSKEGMVVSEDKRVRDVFYYFRVNNVDCNILRRTFYEKLEMTVQDGKNDIRCKELTNVMITNTQMELSQLPDADEQYLTWHLTYRRFREAVYAFIHGARAFARQQYTEALSWFLETVRLNTNLLAVGKNAALDYRILSHYHRQCLLRVNERALETFRSEKDVTELFTELQECFLPSFYILVGSSAREDQEVAETIRQNWCDVSSGWYPEMKFDRLRDFLTALLDETADKYRMPSVCELRNYREMGDQLAVEYVATVEHEAAPEIKMVLETGWATSSAGSVTPRQHSERHSSAPNTAAAVGNELQDEGSISSRVTTTASLRHVIETKGAVVGLTIVKKKLFVIYRYPTGVIDVYDGDGTEFKFEHQIAVNEVGGWYEHCLTSCVVNNCLYVGCHNGIKQDVMVRVDAIDSNNVVKWPLKDNYSFCSMSVNSQHHLLVGSCSDRSSLQGCLLEFTTHGQLIRETVLASIYLPTSTIELNSKEILVCCHMDDDDYPAVCIVDAVDGRVQHRFRIADDTEMDIACLAFDRSRGFIFVADCDSNSIAVLDSVSRESLFDMLTLDRIYSVYFDDERNLLFVGQWNGQVVVYSV